MFSIEHNAESLRKHRTFDLGISVLDKGEKQPP